MCGVSLREFSAITWRLGMHAESAADAVSAAVPSLPGGKEGFSQSGAVNPDDSRRQHLV